MTDKQVHESMRRAFMNDLYQRIIVAMSSSDTCADMLAEAMHQRALSLCYLAAGHFCPEPPPPPKPTEQK